MLCHNRHRMKLCLAIKGLLLETIDLVAGVDRWNIGRDNCYKHNRTNEASTTGEAKRKESG